jgi:hypothetical protein
VPVINLLFFRHAVHVVTELHVLQLVGHAAQYVPALT